MIRKVAIWCHTRKPEAARLAKKLKRALSRRASIVPLDRAQILFVIGGDGTILSIAPQAARRGVPIVGINVGRLGFLAEYAEANILAGLGSILSEKFSVEERRMLDVWETKPGNRHKKLGAALNEMLLVRDGLARIAELSISIGGDPAGLFSVDGIIVSTPTGSTGHALAAGGPVLSPKMRAFLIVPLCPHPPRARPMVVEEEEVDITWTGRYSDLRISLDGQRIHKVSPGPTSIKILPSPFSLKFVRPDRRHAPSFFNIVRQKLI